MGPQRRLGIYVDYESPSITEYLEPKPEDLFTARFTDCHFDESVFPTLGGENKQLKKEIDWNALFLSHLDPCTKVIKSHILAVNAPIRIDILVGQSNSENESKPCLKPARLVGSKDKNPRKNKGAN
ncbi:hypothetical protein CDL12_27911 [Handroanthus impetiginosus]|uniref:Uncharacterized protein n=1 Tax=Handroanthus impetiginosus TaxID=429701 RepID=A0A2G9G371_9LAMI|nr:hypothetical protein CDL12_27911 [Handroanthus impetiginosus]